MSCKNIVWRHAPLSSRLKQLPAGLTPFLLQIHPFSFNKRWQEKRVGGLSTGYMIHAHLTGQLIIFVKRKIAVDFWTKRKCHLRVTGDSAEGHLPDSDAIGWVAIPLWPLVPTSQRAEWQHLRRSCVTHGLVWVWLQRWEIALALVKGLLQTTQWERRIKGVTRWRVSIQPSEWS